MPRHWYAATVKPLQEEVARRHLVSDGFQVFHPRVRVAVPKRDGSLRYRIKPWLPGYILVQFDRARQPWWRISSTKGVGHLLMNGELPCRVRQGVVEALVRAHGDDFVEDQRVLESAVVSAGDRFTVNGVVGEFTALETSHSKIAFMMEFMGRPVRTEIAAGRARKVSA